MKIIDVNEKEREVIFVCLNDIFPGFVEVQFKKHKEWYPLDEFKSKNPSIVLQKESELKK